MLRLALTVMTIAILFGTIAPALSAEVVPIDPRDAQIQALSQQVSTLETENAQLIASNNQLVAINGKLRALVIKQGNKIKRLRARVLRAYRRILGLIRRLATVFGPWHSATASWYGPGFYGSGLAGGGVLRPGMMIFAHRTMKFGTKVQFRYGRRTVIATAMDRGPYVAGRDFDLGPGTASALGFDGVGTVRWRIVR